MRYWDSISLEQFAGIAVGKGQILDQICIDGRADLGIIGWHTQLVGLNFNRNLPASRPQYLHTGWGSQGQNRIRINHAKKHFRGSTRRLPRPSDAQQAEPAFSEADKLNPDDFEANLYLGAILYMRRDMTEAKAYLDHALALKPDDLMRSFVGNELTC